MQVNNQSITEMKKQILKIDDLIIHCYIDTEQIENEKNQSNKCPTSHRFVTSPVFPENPRFWAEKL